MGKENAALYAFNAGEVSKNALARVDVARMRLAAQCQVNWMPWVVGATMLRPGLLYIGEVLSDQKTKLLPFVFSKTDTSLLECTANLLRVWINEQLLTRVAVGTTISDPTFQGGGTWSTAGTSAGCTASIAGGVATLTASAIGGIAQIKQTLTIAGGDQGKEHGLRVVVSNGPVTIRIGSAAGLSDYLSQTVIDTGTHSLPFTPTGASAFLQIESSDAWAKTLTGVSIEAVGVVQIPTTWAASDLPNLRWDQSGDIVFVACYGQQQRKIERRGTRPGARGFSFVLYRSDDGPFHETADNPTLTMTPSVTSGNGTITASGAFFNSGHVGALLRLFTPQFNAAFPVCTSAFFTPPVKVSGLFSDRSISVIISGAFTGTWTMQRSLLGPTSGFADVGGSDGGWLNAAGARATPTFTADFNQTNGSYNDGYAGASGAAAPPNAYNNVVAWYRLGFNAGNLSSGAPTMELGVNSGGTFGIARITAVNSSTQVQVEVLTPFSSTTATGQGQWQISDWCPAFGWPTSVCFHEDRLCWFGPGQFPFAGSGSNNYTSFAEEDQYGNSLGDSGAILVGFGQGPMDAVSWGLSLTRLLMGREQSIASARSSNFDQAMTPTNNVVRDCSDQGAARLPAIKAGKRGIYVQQTTRKVYELFFNAQEFDYDDRDLTRLNLDIGVPGFVTTAKADQPDKMIWLPRGDGQCAALLYDVKDEIEAWWRIQTLGVIEDVCVLPSDGRGAAGEQLENLSYFVVNRTINGTTRRFIERLARRDQCVGGSLNRQLDCAVIYSGAATTSITLAQLPQTTVAVWADGAFIGTGTTNGAGLLSPLPDNQAHSNIVAGLAGATIIGSVNVVLSNNAVPKQVFSAAQGTLTVGTQYNGYPAEVFADIAGTGKAPQHIGSIVVSGGTITLPNNQVASTIVAFLGYVAPFQSAKLAYAAQLGSALTMKKKADHVGLVLYDVAPTSLLQGQRMDLLDAMPQMEADQVVPAGTVWSEYDGPSVELPGEWDTDARLCLLAQAPSPCTLGAAVIALQTNERA